MEEDIKIIKKVIKHFKNNNAEKCLSGFDIKAIENILNELERLQEDNQEWKMIFDVFNEREYRKKYLEEERAKRPKLLYPDADEIYKRYYELKTENSNITRELLSRTDKLNDSIPKQIIRNKIKEYYGLKEIDITAYEEQIKPLKELLGDE